MLGEPVVEQEVDVGATEDIGARVRLQCEVEEAQRALTLPILVEHSRQPRRGARRVPFVGAEALDDAQLNALVMRAEGERFFEEATSILAHAPSEGLVREVLENFGKARACIGRARRDLDRLAIRMERLFELLATDELISDRDAMR